MGALDSELVEIEGLMCGVDSAKSLIACFRSDFEKLDKLIGLYQHNPRLRTRGSSYDVIRRHLAEHGFVDVSDKSISYNMSKVRKERGEQKRAIRIAQAASKRAGVGVGSQPPMNAVVAHENGSGPVRAVAVPPGQAVVQHASPGVRTGAKTVREYLGPGGNDVPEGVTPIHHLKMGRYQLRPDAPIEPDVEYKNSYPDEFWIAQLDRLKKEKALGLEGKGKFERCDWSQTPWTDDDERMWLKWCVLRLGHARSFVDTEFEALLNATKNKHEKAVMWLSFQKMATLFFGHKPVEQD